MERGSHTHGPRLDDELQREFEPEERGEPTSGRVEPHREIEDLPGEDPLAPEPEADPGPEEPDAG